MWFDRTKCIWPIDTKDSSAGELFGYRNFGYLVNYAFEVEDGDGYIWGALKKGSNVYKWLTEKAGDDSRWLWSGILERNLTGDFGYIKVLAPTVLPHGMQEQNSNYHG